MNGFIQFTGKQCPWIAIRLPALLVEGIPQAPMNAKFHSVAARPMDAFDPDQITAGRGLFLFRHRVPPPFLRADPHWPLPPVAPAFPHGSAGTRRNFFLFLQELGITYTVNKGDTLWDIAKKYLGSGTRYTEIVKLNGLKTSVIIVGQKLKIPTE